MKKILNLSALFIVLVIALFAYSCGNDSESDSTDANNVCQHRDADDNNLCDKCKEAYTDGKDINDLPSHTHSYTMKRVNSTYLASEASCTTPAQYYYSCECGSADHSSTFEHGEKSAHSYKDMVCTICKSPYYSDGLDYIFDARTSTYSVAGIGDCRDRFISIPPTYNGYPVVEILNDAFFSTFLTGVIVPEGVTHIREGAFYNCTHITDVKLPQSLISIEEAAFFGCNSLESITIPFVGASSDATGYKSHFGYIFGFTTSTSYSTAHYVETYWDHSVYYTYNIPSSLENVVIKSGSSSIGHATFYNCKYLKSVTILSQVTSIGEYAFYGCYYLNNIVLPNSLTTIEDSAFSSCDNLANIIIPDGVTSIGDSAFSGCKSLTNVTIPKGATIISNRAFEHCTSLTSVVIPDSVTSIGDSAFSYCTSLTSVTIPDSVTTIGNGAFSGCTSLTSITIPDCVTTIEDVAFKNCTSLTSVTIGNGVTTIGYYAFSECDHLTSIKYRGTRSQWNAISKSRGWDDNTGNYTITYNYDGE